MVVKPPGTAENKQVAAVAGGLLLEPVGTKLDWLASKFADLFTNRLPALEARLEELRELLTHRRKDYFVVEEFAEATGRSCYTIRRWIATKKLHAIRLPDGGPRGKLLIPRAEFDRVVAAGNGGNVSDVQMG